MNWSESSGGGFAIDGDHVAAVLGPGDAELIEGRAEQGSDIGGVVGEVVAHARHAAIVGDDAAAVAVDQTADEVLGGGVDVSLLPRFQDDRAQVLRSRSVLREQAGPVFGE
ncbi:hypothetical protein ACWDUN_26345 [Mycobacterium sp. NPDC003323]